MATELRTETMTVNMGPQHPSTHGVLRLVLELSGETVVSADTTVGFLHTGIEKTAEQKKWQQVIPLVERMDYLGAQSNSLAFCLSVERLLDVKMPERVQNIRVLIAELQRLASHLVWLATHALEIGAVSVMMYCFREREQLLNVNEMLAGFRMFPSYIRIGGLREDLPNGFHQAVKKLLDDFPSKLSEYEDLLTKNQIWLKRTQTVGVITKDDAMTYGLVGPMARAAGVPYDVRKAFPYLGYETYDFAVPTQTTGDVYARYLVRVAEMRESTKIAQQALARITPRGVFDIQDYKIVPPPKDKVYTRDGSADSALPDLLAGLQRAGRRGVRADRGAARRARLQHRLGRHQPAVSHQAARAVVLCLPGAAEDAHRRHDCRRHRGDRLDRRRHGRRGSMSFHPLMVYDQRASRSRSASSPTRGPPFTFTPERRAALDDMLTKYPPDQKRSAVLGALYLVQEQQGYLTANGMRHVAGDPRHDAGRGRGRRDLLRDVLQGAGRQVRAPGLPHALVRADGRRAGHRGAVGEAGIEGRRDRRRRACSR